MDAVHIEVGKRIKAARKDRGMTLAELGDGRLSRSFLSAVEHGRSRISLRSLGIVADRLQLPMSHFLPEAVTADSREELGVARYRLRIHGRGTPTLDIDLALRGAAGLVELIPET